MKKIYIGTACSDSPRLENELKKALSKISEIEILSFFIDEVSLPDKASQSPDLCVFIADAESNGLRKEMTDRYLRGKPMLIFARTGIKVTNTVASICQLDQEQSLFCRYDTLGDIMRVLCASLGDGFFGNHYS